MSRFVLEKRELSLALAFGALAFLVSTKVFLSFLNELNPYWSFLIYYAIVFVTIFTLSKIGLTIFSMKIDSLGQVVGTTLIFFSFFLIFNLTNQYVQITTMGEANANACSSVFYGSEDGIVWEFWHHTLGVADTFYARLLAFPLTAFVLTLLGGLLVDKKVKISP